MDAKKNNETNRKEDRKKITVGVTVADFPFSLWLEWDKSCKEQFGDCRWMKMWHDHLSSQSLQILNFLFREIEYLGKRIESLEGKPKDDVRTLGGDAK